jgi:Cu(I)/Ag(I) efflux system membrane fusion protein
MRRAPWIAVALALGAAGYLAGRATSGFPDIVSPALVAFLRSHSGDKEAGASAGAPTSAGAVIYFRHPDGKPQYSLGPTKTSDGRDYRPVYADQDVSFDDDEPSRPEVPERTTAAAEPAAAGGPAAGRILYYRNPMGPPDTSPVPKKDSMGMDYVPVYAGEDDARTVVVPAGRLQRTGVRSQAVERRVLTAAVRAPGTLEEDERRISVVVVRSEAFIEAVDNVTTGERVQKGQPLLRLYSPDIAAAAAQYLSAVGAEGARRRLENLAVPQDVIAEIERTRRVPLTIVWRAPRDGVVVERAVTEGMRVMPGDVLFRIADHSVLWAIASVPERELASVVEGRTASLRVRGLPGRAFQGTVTRIYPRLSAETRTARVRIEVTNTENLLRPAMYAEVDFATGSQLSVLSVPDSAVIDSGTQQRVIIDKGEGRFEPRDVKVGMRGGGFTEVLAGVEEGDRVVVSANFLIDAESNLRSALQGLTAPDTKP